jgi:hypothetical protein
VLRGFLGWAGLRLGGWVAWREHRKARALRNTGIGGKLIGAG